ncbi:transcription-repair coupling factor [Caloramator quimbayensis]|uniref:Transcription-repair-coupling factor n=1 Tax=Caloramator quimbayensis TaxID=1147123 RepID=A0A1T4Y0W1_9CLOT|nr:transcription-repair coupling factor [Caloramator quimbayensis]SKA95416.1 transcription-repair coupling factor [Caloramator quimbayensis]
MRFEGLNSVFRQHEGYEAIISSLNSRKTPCQVHGLSESQKAYVSCCLFDSLKRQILILTHNDIEARKIYDDIKTFTDKCFYFPIKEMVFNVDVTSGEVKTERLKTIYKILSGEPIIVVASIDSVFYNMPPKNLFIKNNILLKPNDSFEIENLTAKLIEIGYERVEMVEGVGQFAQRGGIIDIFSPLYNEPFRIEFFGDEIDTIRTFDVISQRSRSKVDEALIYPARETIIESEKIPLIINNLEKDFELKYKSFSKKNKESADRLKQRVKENIEKLRNFKYFEGIDSYMLYLYNSSNFFIDYFNNPLVILDESGRIAQRIKTSYDEFEETFKALLEKGDVMPKQGEYFLPPEYILDAVKKNNIIALNMLPRVVEDIKPLSVVNFNAVSMNPISGNIEFLLNEIKSKIKNRYHILIMAGTAARAERLARSLRDEEIDAIFSEQVNEIKAGSIVVTFGSLSRGMEFPDLKLIVISDKEVFKEKTERKKTFTKKAGKIQSFTDLRAGDYVVHVNHGIGIYKGISQLEIDGIKKDYLLLQYQGGDTLYVPAEQLDMVQKYIGADDNPPKVYKLGGSEWAKTKKKVKESLKEMAENLIELYAVRRTIKGYAFSKDTPWQKQFEEEFPYDETPDQLTAIEEIKRDMEKTQPMDRLLCGDVGYGKTEVAMRAAFKAVMDGKQVAVLVPTTILAEQHYNNFKQRFMDFPVTIDMISRFRSREQQKKTLLELHSGNIDIVIGTHRLLQKDVRFKDLGLLIVDEEQRFGVSHKEKIKLLKKNIDVLTLTATPIPRTLHMSMIGVRDMSIIETPPEERYPVQTYVMEYNENIIRDAIIREMSRGGQVFFVYNRVETIKDMQSALTKLVPEAKITIGHGKMDEKELEEAILSFISGDGDVLLCTTIIETGIDMPNVNTLIVYDADKMGLSQLYQLRGRVGRSNRLAYAYFTYKKDKILTEVAEKRLKAIKEFTEFGSGFKIAMRDLEIRGAGNLLGTQQHGHMAAVGYDLYCRLLEETVRELKGDAEEEYIEPSIEITTNAYIPDNFIGDEMIKIETYKKIASIENMEDKIEVEEEIIDRFGDIPPSVENLINIAYIKSLSKKLKITNIKQVERDIYIHFKDASFISIDVLRDVNLKMDRALSYGSTTQPIIKLKIKNISQNVNLIKKFLELISDLHNISK